MARSFRKEMKEPDAFQLFIAEALRWFQAYRAFVIGGVAAILLLVLAFFGYRFWTERTRRLAGLSYSLAVLAGSEGTDGPEMEAALRKTAAQYPKTRAGIMAQLRLANSLLNRGAAKSAEGEFRFLLKNPAATDLDRALASRGLAASLAAQERCGDAVPIWKRLKAETAAMSPEDVYVPLGDCLERMGKAAAALKVYEELNQKFPRSPYLTARIQELLKENAGKP